MSGVLVTWDMIDLWLKRGGDRERLDDGSAGFPVQGGPSVVSALLGIVGQSRLSREKKTLRLF